MRAILDTARALNNFVRIDMEGSRYTQDTLDLFQETVSLYPNHVGVVIQAYLYRSQEDVRRLSALGCNIRLCKGAYMEPADIAFPKRQDVDRNFIKLLELLLLSPSYTAIATHNVKMIEHVHRFTAQHDVPLSRYEHQMVYGVGPRISESDHSARKQAASLCSLWDALGSLPGAPPSRAPRQSSLPSQASDPRLAGSHSPPVAGL